MDTPFQVLAHSYRRCVLADLLQSSAQQSLDAVDAVVAHTEDHDQHDVEVELRHIHLPKLEDQGYIDRAENSTTVSPGPAFTEVRPLLTILEENSETLAGSWPA